MTGNIWVMAEQWRGQLSEISFELLALGRELADGLGVPLEALLLGHQVEPLAGELGGADTVLCVDDLGLAEPLPDVYGGVVAELISHKQPQAVLIPWTNVAADLLGLLSAQLDGSYINFCQDVQVVDGRLRARCLLYGGKVEAFASGEKLPLIIGVLPGARVGSSAAGEAPSLEQLSVSVPKPRAIRFTGYLEPEPGDLDITQQEVLISVGRGIQGEDNVEVAQELSVALGGAVSGSRPVIDQGWLPLSRQVGKSGSIVKPKLYIAAGISGAPEHVEGMKGAELIIAINTDPEAPIYSVAHLGVVEDATDVLPALLEAVRARKG